MTALVIAPEVESPRTTTLITGATAGIGFPRRRHSREPGCVLITGRDEARGHDAVSRLRQQAGHDAVDLIASDALSVRDNIRLAEEVAGRVRRVDLLINNVGGGGFAERQETPEGIEATLALNFVGPFAPTTRLLALFERRPSRIVNVVSSAYAMWARDPFDDLDARGRYVGIEAIAHAKLLNLLFTLALARRLASCVLSPRSIPAWRGLQGSQH
jgi:NAD(P)-dependent dehydrogenase (short-subunit alcohol dehydrogenase family)